MARIGKLLPRNFYLRPAADVARDLLGMQLKRGPVVLRITEVEAYGGPEDTASHARFGRTHRNAPMWEDGGCIYIYMCYGLYHMLNIVAGPAGEGAAVLVRSCEPLAGLELVQTRRGHLQGPSLLTGPGKVAQALALDRTFNGQPLCEPGGLELRLGEPPQGVLQGPRVGIPYSEPAHREALLRFAIEGSPWVSERRTLRQH
jgi:DNA-3-methyladenine glycosylase